ncbi:MAG: hypothetical protein IPL56_03135 [Saprospiraceae bacterium]|nr:hypothetical protein [Saprospiraceae bacterium]MBK7435648.1 hypothetical protein [Saprospiraceae bacterium]MBK8511250.1 hypothetical protein [Saprospiraceae bacterium]
MEKTLMYLIIVLFALLLLVNIFFRIKVIKSLKVLRESNIQFDAAMVFDKDKLKSFIAAQPPTNGKAISDFSKYLRSSITMAVLLIALITLFGAVLMYYRQHE